MRAFPPSVSNGIGRVAKGAPAPSNISAWSATGTTRPKNVHTWSKHSASPHIPNRAGATCPVTTRAVPFVTEGAKHFVEAHASSDIPVQQSAFDLHIIHDPDDSLNTESTDDLSLSQGFEVHYAHPTQAHYSPVTLATIQNSSYPYTSDLLELDSYRIDPPFQPSSGYHDCLVPTSGRSLGESTTRPP